MIDRLTAPRAHVRHEAVAGIGDALRPGEVGCDREHPPHQRGIGVGQVQGGRDVLLRQDEDVRRRRRRDIADREDVIVLVDLRGRQVSRDDAAEEAVGRHHKLGLVLMRKPITPTSPAIRYDTYR